MPDPTPLSRLTDALPATHDGPIGVHSADLRALLGSIVNVTGLCEPEDSYALGEGKEG
jgi:hypothetical protein